jgi:hypothetical protein
MADIATVTKSSGEQHPFSKEKLRSSLSRSGANEKLVDSVAQDVEKLLYDGISTKKIYQIAFRLLQVKEKLLAARYSLKDAIMQLGPTGYPFERFVGEILKKRGYTVSVSQLIQGKCVQHEVDVLAHNHARQIMVECKYHNTRGKVCNVHVPLYINARFHDLMDVWKNQPDSHEKKYEAWVVTNTRFTSDAADYGRCAGLRLIGWDYPQREGLKEMVENAGLFPITTLTSLSHKHKQALLDDNIVLCSELYKHENLLSKMLSDKKKLKAVLDEARDLSAIADIS